MEACLDFVVVEHDGGLARSVRRVLGQHGRCSTAGTLEEAAAALGDHGRPLGIVTAEHLPDGSGTTWLAVLRSAGWSGSCLVMTAAASPDVQARAVHVQAFLVLKPIDARVLEAFARAAEARQPRVGRALALVAARARLSPREHELLGAAVEGTARADLADHLAVSENTVKCVVRSTLTKLGLRGASLQAAVALVRELATTSNTKDHPSSPLDRRTSWGEIGSRSSSDPRAHDRAPVSITRFG